MNKSQFKDKIKELIAINVANAGIDEKIAIAKKAIMELEKEQKWNTTNSGNSWTDDELRLVLSHPPTQENMILLAKAFKRGYGSIEQIFRWAGQSEKRIEEERGDDAFTQSLQKTRRMGKGLKGRAHHGAAGF